MELTTDFTDGVLSGAKNPGGCRMLRLRLSSGIRVIRGWIVSEPLKTTPIAGVSLQASQSRAV